MAAEMTTAHKRAEKAEAIDRLRGWLPPGATVYTVLRHRAPSGMSRRITVHSIENNEPHWLTWNVARATGLRLNRDRDEIVMQGTGMDMGFECAYVLSHALYPDGFGCIGAGCPSSDHANGDRDYTPHTAGQPTIVDGVPVFGLEGSLGPISDPGTAGIHWHRDGGYALRHRWI